MSVRTGRRGFLLGGAGLGLALGGFWVDQKRSFAYQPRKKLAIESALAFLASGQREDGIIGNLVVTAGAFGAFIKAGENPASIQRLGGRSLQEAFELFIYQAEEGELAVAVIHAHPYLDFSGWVDQIAALRDNPNLPIIANAARALRMIGVDSADGRLVAFQEAILAQRKADFGWGPPRGERGTADATALVRLAGFDADLSVFKRTDGSFEPSAQTLAGDAGIDVVCTSALCAQSEGLGEETDRFLLSHQGASGEFIPVYPVEVWEGLRPAEQERRTLFTTAQVIIALTS